MANFGNLQIAVPMGLAPMAGVTNAAFRRICREFAQAGLHNEEPDFGVKSFYSSNSEKGLPRSGKAETGLYVCEMITARALVEQKPNTLDLLKPDQEEPCRSVQLHGVDPQTMNRAAQMLIEKDLADHIDLNFGCPVPKVTRKGGGSALPWKYPHYQEILRQVVAGARQASERVGRPEVPVTVKIRIGIDDEHQTYLEAAQRAEDSGIAGIVLHGRTTGQYYSGKADWEPIKKLVETVSIPVWGNGDVFSVADAQKMMVETGCVGIEIGRGVQGRPWLFYDLAQAFSGGNRRWQPTLGQVVEVINRHARYLVEWTGNPDRSLRDMRKHIGWYLRGFAVGGSVRGDLTKIRTLDELAHRLSQLDLDQPYPSAADGKRGRAGHARRPHLPEGWLDSHEVTGAGRKILENAELDTYLDEGGY